MTAVPAAKDGLLAALATRPALDAVQRAWTHPGKRIKAEAIYLGDTAPVQRPKAFGNRRRDEEFEVEVVVTVLRKSEDAERTERRLWALVAEIEEAVRADATLGGVLLWAQVNDIEPNTFRDPGATVAEAVVKVGCKARI